MTPPIFKVCAADPAVTALLGISPCRLYPFGEAPEGVEYPYATWQGIGGAPENYLDDRPDMDRISLQVDVWAKTGTSATAVATALRDAIEGHAYITAWRGTSTDPETKSKRVSFDVSWHVER